MLTYYLKSLYTNFVQLLFVIIIYYPWRVLIDKYNFCLQLYYSIVFIVDIYNLYALL